MVAFCHLHHYHAVALVNHSVEQGDVVNAFALLDVDGVVDEYGVMDIDCVILRLCPRLLHDTRKLLIINK
jgi:hypothetical protein